MRTPAESLTGDFMHPANAAVVILMDVRCQRGIGEALQRCVAQLGEPVAGARQQAQLMQERPEKILLAVRVAVEHSFQFQSPKHAKAGRFRESGGRDDFADTLKKHAGLRPLTD